MIAIISIIVCVNFVFTAVCFTDEFFVFILTFINKAILQEMQSITTAPSPAVKKKRIKSLGWCSPGEWNESHKNDGNPKWFICYNSFVIFFVDCTNVAVNSYHK